MAPIPRRRPVRLALVRGVTAAFAILLLIAAQTDRGFAASQPLKFFKNYFVTGDYAVAGVGLWGRGVKGIASGSIVMSGVPAGAEILSAYLYWQAVTSNGPESGATGATFNGQLLSIPGPPAVPTRGGTIASIVDINGTSPCWSGGGGTGSSGGAKKTFSYRADVKRFLPMGTDGRHVVNRAHAIQLPDSGNANSTPKALGASLVVVYRSPSSTEPLKAVVIYDGLYTLNNATRGMTQVMKGFYDPAAGVPGKLTHIVGGAQANKSEVLIAPGVNELNPFRGVQGEAWDNVTRSTNPITGDSLTTSVNPPGHGSNDCLVWSAIIYSTKVNDSDIDGLLDMWESSSSTLFDPLGNALPNLKAMGAEPLRKDLFVEIGYMATSATTYGGVPKPAHTHAPTPAAIEKIGKMFDESPVLNPDGSTGIALHIDLGPNYTSTPAISQYLVPVTQARGGEAFNEVDTLCTRPANAPQWICQFSQYPGTVGWKSGFRFLRDHPLNNMTDAQCRTADTDNNPLTRCERVFDRERKDMFRYVLFAHALGLPKEDCIIDNRANPNFGFPDTVCQATNGLFHVPVTNTGVADFPGGDAMVALGGFDDGAGRPVGTDYMQAATLAHELGHTFGLRHGGAPTEPNCKPNYQSVMNYLFQLRGLRKNTGGAVLDFSRQRFGGLLEGSLSVPDGLGADLDNGSLPAYRTGWYAPFGPGVVGTAPTKHCDGTPLGGQVPLFRVDSGSVEDTFGQIYWTKSSTTPLAPGGQDLNFNGSIDSLNAGFNDWQNIRLNQIGSRRNVGAWFWVKDPAPLDYGAFMGPLSLDTGLADMGLADMGLADMGSGDVLQGDFGRGDLNRGDLGRAGLGLADMGLADMGLADMGLADMGAGDAGMGDSGLGDSADGELTTELVEAHGFAPPNELTALIVGLSDGCAGLLPANCHRIQLDWTPTNLGSESAYEVHRVSGTSITIGPGTLIHTEPKVPGQSTYTFVDPTELPGGVFTYVVAAVFGGGISAIDVQVTAVNDAPVGGADSYTVASGALLTVPAVTGVSGLMVNDTDIDSPAPTSPPLTVAPVATVFSPNGGFATDFGGRARLNPSGDGSFIYQSRPGYTGPDTFSYVVKDKDTSRTSAPVLVTITVTPAAP